MAGHGHLHAEGERCLKIITRLTSEGKKREEIMGDEEKFALKLKW